MVKAYPYRWQGPGNGEIFDSNLENWKGNKMSERAIGVLEFIDQNPLIEKNEFEAQIAEFIFKKYGNREEQTPNNSIKGHFFRPLQFMGFIINLDGKLSLSKDGKNFLNFILNENYEEAKKSFVLQLLKVSYPNMATKDNKLKLYPFRILFKLLLEYDKIHINFFMTKIPYITNVNCVYSLKELLDDENYLNRYTSLNQKELKSKCKEKHEDWKNKLYYDKWKSWVMAPLVKINILNLEFKSYSLDDSIKRMICQNINEVPYEDMFFNSNNEFEDTKNKFTKKNRNIELIKSVLKNSNYNCFFDEKHVTFPNEHRPNYVEGHHIIPLEWNDSYEEELDCNENIIALCPNCHKAMHYSIDEYKKDLIEKILNENKLFTNKFIHSDEDKHDLYYCCLNKNRLNKK